MAGAAEGHPDEAGLVSGQGIEGVGKLDLADGARAGGLEQGPDFRRQHIAADDREVGGGGSRRGLFDEPADSDGAVVGALTVDDTVAMGLVVRHLHDRHGAGAGALVDANELSDARIVVVVDEVVPEEHRERRITHRGARAQHRVAEAQGLFLAHRQDPRRGRDPSGSLELVFLAAGLEGGLELEGVIEMILDGALAAAVDHHDIADPGGEGLLDHKLDGGHIDDGQHLFGHRPGRGQKPRSQPRCWNHRLVDTHHLA